MDPPSQAIDHPIQNIQLPRQFFDLLSQSLIHQFQIIHLFPVHPDFMTEKSVFSISIFFAPSERNFFIELARHILSHAFKAVPCRRILRMSVFFFPLDKFHSVCNYFAHSPILALLVLVFANL